MIPSRNKHVSQPHLLIRLPSASSLI